MYHLSAMWHSQDTLPVLTTGTHALIFTTFYKYSRLEAAVIYLL